MNEENFNPLEFFVGTEESKEMTRPIENISWILPEKEESRQKLYEFLAVNKNAAIQLFGGSLTNVTIDTLHLAEHSKSLILDSMPTVTFHIWSTLPALEHIHISNVD